MSGLQYNGRPVQGILRGVIWDAYTLTEDTLTDTYNYYAGGLTGKLVATVVVTYTDSNKDTEVSAVRTF